MLPVKKKYRKKWEWQERSWVSKHNWLITSETKGWMYCSSEEAAALNSTLTVWLIFSTSFLHMLVLAHLRPHCSPHPYLLSLTHLVALQIETFSSSLSLSLSLSGRTPSPFPQKSGAAFCAPRWQARHWQMAARRTHWRAVAPTDTVNPPLDKKSETWCSWQRLTGVYTILLGSLPWGVDCRRDGH